MCRLEAVALGTFSSIFSESYPERLAIDVFEAL